MTRPWQALLPERLHDTVRGALVGAYGRGDVLCLGRLRGGASGAIALMLVSGGRAHLLRVEGQYHPSPNPHHYPCMRIAAAAGVAPALHYLDEETGLAIMDFVNAVPLERFPGGRIALARVLGGTLARLQATPLFPALGDYRDRVRDMLLYAETGFVPGLLDRHKEGFERLICAMSWDDAGHVSSHNDLSPLNLLFDGGRLWLVDWETGYRNDPFADLAVAADHFAERPRLESALVRSWLGRPATASERLRLAQMKVLTRLYYGGLMIASAGVPPERMTSLDAPTPAGLALMVRQGKLAPTSREARLVRARMYLAAFLAGLEKLREGAELGPDREGAPPRP